MNVSIIIPVFNEEAAIGATLEGLIAAGWNTRAEILVVDDGSADATAEVVGRYPVRLLRHRVNRGYGAALKTGIRAAKTDHVLIMDSDGQHTAEMLEDIVRQMPHYDMVIGDRAAGSHQVRSRKFGKWIIRVVGEYLVEQKLPDYNSGLRSFDRQAIANLLHVMPNGFSFSTTSTLAFINLGRTIGIVPIQAKPRVGRPSNVRPTRDGAKTLMLLLRIVMLFNPMKIFLPAAGVMGIWGLSVAVYDIVVSHHARVSNGAVTVMMFAMLLFFIGLLADQISMLNLREQANEV
ncbi:MAG: glycosyltransferase family 2 protein [Kiritimatiellae bacterium]|nr:glycosyltransferase family 2 protein [Kiritimatiellia bacterium]